MSLNVCIFKHKNNLLHFYLLESGVEFQEGLQCEVSATVTEYNTDRGKTKTTQTAHTLYLDRLSRPIVSRNAMLRFHVMFFD